MEYIKLFVEKSPNPLISLVIPINATTSPIKPIILNTNKCFKSFFIISTPIKIIGTVKTH